MASEKPRKLSSGILGHASWIGLHPPVSLSGLVIMCFEELV